MNHLLKLFLGLFLISIAAYFYLLSLDYEYAGDYVLVSIASTIALPYTIFMKKKKLYISLFLFCFCLSDLLYFIYDKHQTWFVYYLMIILYALAYTFLGIETIKFLKFKKIVKEFKLQLLILLGLSLFIGYITINMEIYRLEKQFFLEFGAIDYVTSIYYQVSLCIMFSGSLINYLDRYDEKSLFLFLGCTFLIFMELVGVALYILKSSQTKTIVIIYMLLTIIAFYFLIRQCDLEYKNNDVLFNEDL
ncbi:hypothetical protein V8G61_11375 [Gaetbulibacter sp. M240]|uniref:hypothetical protein n=1 Tax=Gaetbulibacter sp. M240 TaxID=3126511 RepID=UPI00374E2402